MIHIRIVGGLYTIMVVNFITDAKKVIEIIILIQIQIARTILLPLDPNILKNKNLNASFLLQSDKFYITFIARFFFNYEIIFLNELLNHGT